MLDKDAESSSMAARLHGLVARQLSLPEGPGGLAVAAAMRLVNWLPNKRAIEALDIGADDDVLEIGFGPGHALKRLCELTPSGTVTGVDRSLTMFREAATRNQRALAAGRLSLSCSSCERLPLKEELMDHILAVNVLYFISSLGTALSEARRVLRPGGSMAVYVTDRSSMNWLQFVGRETLHSFDIVELRQLLRGSAFGQDEMEIRRIWLPLGFRGLVAKVTKTV